MKNLLLVLFFLAFGAGAQTTVTTGPATAPTRLGVTGAAFGAVPALSDVAAGATVFKAGNAYPQASTNTTGGALCLAGGIGRRLFTVVDYSLIDAIDTVTVTVNGSATVKTAGGTDWTAATSNAVTATSLASALNSISGITAAAVGASVYLSPASTTCTLTIATSMDAGEGTATSGTDGTVSLGASTFTLPLPLASLATQATNTIVANATSGTAAPTAVAIGSCSTSGSALIWTTNSGFGCNTAIAASTATTATNQSGGTVNATTGAFSSTVTLSGTAANLALGSNFISNGGTDAGLSLDASNNGTFSGNLQVGTAGNNSLTVGAAGSGVSVTVAAADSIDGFTNDVGGTLNLKAGRGTGSGASEIVMYISAAGGGGTSLNAHTEALRISNGQVKATGVIAPAASGTRFLCISTTGVIASQAGACVGT